MLHNRGLGFTLAKDHPNRLAPGKRPLHTLVPAFLMKDGTPFMAFGVMGGDNQAQAHVQIVVNVVDFGMNVQEAGDAPRVRHLEEGLAVESGIAPAVLKSLQAARPRAARRARCGGRLPGGDDRSGHRRVDGRVRSAQGRARGRVLGRQPVLSKN